MTAVIGIDPGIKGAVCHLDGDHSSVYDMPLFKVNGKNVLNLPGLIHMVESFGISEVVQVFIERAQAMPGQGVSSMFNYGRMFGQIEGVIACFEMRYTLLSPAKWKRDLGVQKDKDAARARASQLLPHMADQWPLKKHDGRAEAALIALWGQRWLESA